MAEPVRVGRLTDQEGQKLQQIVRHGGTDPERYRRAMMLLASAGRKHVGCRTRRLSLHNEDVTQTTTTRPTRLGQPFPRWTLRKIVTYLRCCPQLRCRVVQETRLDTALIREGRRVIDPVFLNTPLDRCEALGPGLGCTVSIKPETTNPVHSFKARGPEVIVWVGSSRTARETWCALARATADRPSRGPVAAGA